MKIIIGKGREKSTRTWSERVFDTIVNDIRVFTGASKEDAELATKNIILFLDEFGYEDYHNDNVT
jgi:hypothetical protein